MKVTLAIVLAALAWAGTIAASRQQSAQLQGAPQEKPPSTTEQTTPQQQGAPSPVQPCAQSKDTCELSEPAPQQPASTPPAADKQSNSSEATKTPSSKKTKGHRHRPGKKQAVVQDGSGLKKTIVREGGTSDPKAVLTPGDTANGTYSPEMTADLLSATDANLKQATSRPLSASQEETVSQIKLFMEQASAAVKVGDLDRGHNLALKAHLLSDDLVNH